MTDRTKIQLLIMEGAVRKIGEKRLPNTKFTCGGTEETFQLTDYGERKYRTLKNAMILIDND